MKSVDYIQNGGQCEPMKTNEITANGNDYRIELNDDGKLKLWQRNTHGAAMGSEWQVVARAKMADGKMVSGHSIFENTALLEACENLAKQA